MRRIAALLLVLFAALPAAAQDLHRLVSQVAILPMPESGADDVEALVRAHWAAYFNAPGFEGFRRQHVRVGRFDLDGDGRAELFVMIDHPEWESEKGKPFAVAAWTAKGWRAIGWGWAHEDGVFTTGERLQGWTSIDTPKGWLRWNGKQYQLWDKPAQ